MSRSGWSEAAHVESDARAVARSAAKGKHCGRCGHQLRGRLCGFCLTEMLGGRLGSPEPEMIGPFIRALFVEHWTLSRPILARPH